jgi:hypothetical protein
MSKKQVLAGDLKVFQPLFAVHLTNFTTRQFRVGTWNCSDSVKHPSYNNI